MDNRDQRNETVRHPQPEEAARDARNTAIQDQGHADSEANRQDAARVRTTTPSEISEKTVAEIAAEAEARARR